MMELSGKAFKTDTVNGISSLKENTFNKWTDGDSQQRNGYLKKNRMICIKSVTNKNVLYRK